jgi:hypothetical protein
LWVAIAIVSCRYEEATTMTEEEQFLVTFKAWVEEHPEEADVTQINLTTQKEFTLREILDQLVEAKERKTVVLDTEVLEIKEQVQQWIAGM